MAKITWKQIMIKKTRMSIYVKKWGKENCKISFCEEKYEYAINRLVFRHYYYLKISNPSTL